MTTKVELVGAVATGVSVACDKSTRHDPCTADPNLSAVVCACGRVYARCARHGGEAGARRSLHSHRALYHPKEAGE